MSAGDVLREDSQVERGNEKPGSSAPIELGPAPGNPRHNGRRLEMEILRLTATTSEVGTLVRSALALFREYGGLDAAALRLRRGDEYPYFDVNPRLPWIWNADEPGGIGEMPLNAVCDCVNTPSEDCICSRVIDGQLDPANTLFTIRGSFCSNRAVRMQGVTTAPVRRQDRPSQCHGESFESVGLFPLRAGNERLGLLQLGDRRPGRFTRDAIEFWEDMAEVLAIAIAKLERDEVLARQVQLTRSILDGMPDSVALKDRDGAYREVNQAFCRFAGRERAEILGRKDRDLFPAQVAGRSGASDEAVLRTGERVERDEALEFPEGTRWRRVTKSPIFGAGGQVTGVLCSARDITERKAWETALEESENRFRTMADNIAQLAWIAEPDLTRTWYNRRWYDFTGSTTDQMRGMGWKAVHHPAHVDQAFNHMKRCFEEGVEWEDTFPLRARDGGYRWFLARAIPIRDSEGRIVHWFGTDTDITERREAEQQMAEGRAKLTAALASMSDAVFIADSTGRFIDFNDAFVTFHRFASKAECERAFESYPALFEVFLPDGSPVPPEQWAISRAFNGETEVSAEYWIRRKDTGEFWYGSFSFSPIREESGAIAGAVVVARDVTREKHARETLLEAEERFAATFQFSPAATALTTLEDGFRILDVNAALERFTGYTRDELIGRKASDLGLLADSGDYAAALRRIRASRSNRDVEYAFKHKDGNVRIGLSSSQMVELGGQPCVITSIIDITERKFAESALQDAVRLNQQIIDSASEGIIVYGPDSRYRVWNRFMEEITGIRSSEVVGRLPVEVFPFLEDSGVMARIEAVLRGGPPGTVDFLFRIPQTGKSAWVSDTSGPMLNAAGEVIGVIATVRDITERKRAEEALFETQRLLQGILDQTPALVYVKDPEDHFTLINRAFACKFGRPGETLLGRTTHDIFPRDVAEAHRANDLAVMTNREAIAVREEAVEADEHHTYLSVKFPLVTASGELSGVCGISTDITGDIKAEFEKAHLKEQLAQAQKMESIGRLAGGVAHDFNNLLTVINGYSQMSLDQLAGDDPLHGAIREILNAGERAAGMTRQLLAFSRKQILEPRILDLNRVVEDMRSMLGRLVREDVEVCLTLENREVTVHADPHQLEQVIMNLAVNARDAMPGGGRLQIETLVVDNGASSSGADPDAPAGTWARLTVADSGVGMDEVTLQRIFEPFFTTKGVGSGTGLGLSTVQGIVEQSGGQVAVSSRPGAGTTFRIYLPAVEGCVQPASKPAAARAIHGRETILVVEDQTEVRNYTTAVLNRLGYHVLEAANAGEALMIYERQTEQQIDLVLTDVVMPHVSGRELAARLVKLHPGIRVLYMSGYTDDVMVHHGILDDGTPLLQKPFSPDALGAKVRELLSPKSAARILVADDEPSVRTFLSTVLRGRGYDVVEAADGVEALERAHHERLDLVITDLVMPEREGIEVIQAVRRDQPGAGIIAISGAFDGQFLEVAQMIGADAVIEKPVKPDLLLARVAQVLTMAGLRNRPA